MYADKQTEKCRGLLLFSTHQGRQPFFLWVMKAKDGDTPLTKNKTNYINKIPISHTAGMISITVPYYDSRLNWVHDPAPPRLVAWNRQTQYPAVNHVEIPVTQCPGIFLTPFPVLLVVTIPVLLVIMSPVLLIIIIPVLPALITLCIPIPNVFLSVKTMKTRCPPPPLAAR